MAAAPSELSAVGAVGCAEIAEHRSRKAATGKIRRDFMTGALSETGDIQQREVDLAAPRCQEQNGRGHAWSIQRTWL